MHSVIFSSISIQVRRWAFWSTPSSTSHTKVKNSLNFNTLINHISVNSCIVHIRHYYSLPHKWSNCCQNWSVYKLNTTERNRLKFGTYSNFRTMYQWNLVQHVWNITLWAVFIEVLFNKKFYTFSKIKKKIFRQKIGYLKIICKTIV